jgi:hypothetical protein
MNVVPELFAFDPLPKGFELIRYSSCGVTTMEGEAV